MRLTKAGPRSAGRERGSLQLDSSLVIGLLVLIAAVTLFAFGTSIACLFAKEASQVNRVSFYTTAPDVTTSTSSAGEVTFSTEGMTGPFTIMRGRPGSPGYNPSEVETWDVLKENATSPATGLDVKDGDRVAIVANAAKCGFRLVGAAWGGGGGGGQSGGAWYAATTWTYPDASGGAETDYVSVHDGEGKQIWKDQAIVGGGEAYLYGVSVSEKNLYVGTYPIGSTNGIYAVSDWRDPVTHGELTLFLPFVVATGDGTAYKNDGDDFRVSKDDSELIMLAKPVVPGDPVLLVVDMSTLSVQVVGLPGTPSGPAAYGLDDRAYAMNTDGELYRLGESGLPPTQIGSAPVVSAGLGYEVLSVDASGTALLGSDNQLVTIKVTSAGAVSAMPDGMAGWYLSASNALTPSGDHVLMDGTDNDVNHLRLAASAAGTDIRYPFVEGHPGTEVYGLSSVMGNANISDPPPPPPPPPAGTWNYSVLVNGNVAYSKDFVPANPNSVTLNPIVPVLAVPDYGKDLSGGEYLQPFVRMRTDRTLDLALSGKSDTGRFSANAIRDGVPTASDGFIRPFGTVSDPARTLLANGVIVTPSTWGTHTTKFAPYISLIEHGDAHIAASGPTATLANNLCLSVTKWGETRADEGAGKNRRYSIGGSVFLPQAGEADPRRRVLVQAPMLFGLSGFSVPDTLGGKSMADLSYQIAGISWDSGAGSVPDFSLGFFGNDTSFPAVGANTGRLVASDGTVVSSLPSIMKGNVIEVRITGGTVKPTTSAYVPPASTPIGTMLVAGGTTEIGNSIATSVDNGVTWTLRGGGHYATVSDVEWNGSMWLATGRGLGTAGTTGSNTFATSSDGITWTPRGGGVRQLYFGQAVAWGNSTWVAVGNKINSTTSPDTVFTSPDGITWTKRGQVLPTCYGVVWTGTNFVAVGGTSTGNNVATSPDGITWTVRARIPFTTQVDAVRWNGTRLLALGQGNAFTSGGNVATSDDQGVTWTVRGGSAEITFADAAWNGTLWVAAGKSEDGSNYLFTSPDGITWTPRGRGGLIQAPADVAWNGGVFTAVCQDSTSGPGEVSTSPDGITWKAQPANLFLWGTNAIGAQGVN